MLEILAYKKYKKNKAEKEAKAQQARKSKEASKRDDSPSGPIMDGAPAPVLTEDDERFLERLTSAEQGGDYEEERPALPPRVRTPDLTWDSDTESFRKLKEGKAEESGLKPTSKKANRFSFFQRKDKNAAGLDPTKLTVPAPEINHERDDLSRILDDLNLSAKNNQAFSLSDESTELVRRFTLVLKDLVNGVPTAVDDLKSLLDDRDGTLAKNYERLPKSMKKLVTQLPEKMTSSLGPELLAAATAAAGVEQEGKSGGFKGAAKRFLVPKNMADIVTKPGAIVGMLRGIMNALKMRWPAFIGTNVVWSVALFRKLRSIPSLHHRTIKYGGQVSSWYANLALCINSPPIRSLVLPQTWPRGPSRT